MIVSCDSITGRGRKPASRVLQRVGRRVAMRPHDGLGWPQGRRADPLRLLNKPCVLQCMTLCRSLRSRHVARGCRLGFMAPQTDKFIDKAVALVRCEPALTLCHAMPCSAPLSEFCQLRCSPLLSRQCLSSDYSAREAYEMVPQLHARGDRVLQSIRKHVRETREKMDRAG